MAVTIKHKYTSAVPDGGDTSLVQPSNWNDTHDLTGTIPLANGGTNADLSATGPGFLKQASNGASITIALPTATDVGLGNVDNTSDASKTATLVAASHTWALAQTFTAAPVFTDASGTRTAVGLGSVTNDAQTKSAIVPNTAPAAGGLLVGNAGGTAYAPVSASGDVTISSAGVTAIGSNKVSNAMLQNSSMTIAGHSVALGGTQTISASDVGLGSVTNDAQAKASAYPNAAFPALLTTKAVIDFSQANTDFPISIVLPSGYTRYSLPTVRLSGASASLSGATASMWSGAGATGTNIIPSASSITLAVTTDNTASNMQNLSGLIQPLPNTEALNFTTLYFRVQATASGTGTVMLTYTPVS